MKRVLVGLVVSAFFLFLVVRQINFEALGVAFTKVNYPLVLVSVAFHFLGFWLRTLRWKYLLLSFKEVRVRSLFPYLAIGYMSNNVLFLRLGEVVRAHITGRTLGVSRSSMLAVIFGERLYDGLSLVILFSLLIMVLPFPEDLKTPLLLASLLFGVVAVGVFLLPLIEKTTSVKKIFVWVERQERLKRPFASAVAFLEGLKALKSIRSVALVLLASLVIWMIEAGMFWLIAKSFNLDLSIYQAALIALVVGLSTLIPSGPGYLGTFEFFFTQVAVFFGVDRNIAFSYAILTHFTQWLPITLVGFYYAWKMNISVTKLSEGKS